MMDKAEARKRLLRAARYVEEWGNIIADVAGKAGLNTDESLAMSVNADIISVAAWLDAQPEAMWLPVEDGCHGNVRQRDGSLLLDMGIEEDEAVIRLPAGYALCRRVEVQP